MKSLTKLDTFVTAIVAAEVARHLIDNMSQIMGFESKEDFLCYLDQVEMDNLGKGINCEDTKSQ